MTKAANPVAGQFVEDTYLPKRLSMFEFLRRVRDDGLSIIQPEIFDRNLVYTRMLFLNMYTVLKPEYIEQVLLTNQKNYSKPRALRNMLGPVLGEGLLLSEGDFWRRQRRIAAPAFQHNRIAGLVDLMSAEAQAMAEQWRSKTEPFDVAADMMALTFTIIARSMFSIDVANEIETVRRLANHIVSTRPSPLDTLGLPQWIPRFHPKEFREAVKAFDALVARIIAERRGSGADHGDLLSMLLSARDAETGEGMSDKQLRDEMLTIMLAGHETTANALSWCWYLLAQHPEAEVRLHEELERVLGGRAPSREDIPELKYTRMVIEEAMRLYPPVFIFARTAMEEDWIGGVRIKPGAMMIIHPYITHRNPNLWPEPERFIPERFAPEETAKRHRYAYLPFGGGPRICIGNGFALTEAAVILATLAQRYRLRLAPGHEVKPVGHVTLRPRNGVWMTIA
jgi:cytochrome P450